MIVSTRPARGIRSGAILASAVIALFCAESRVLADQVIVNGGYHAQVTDHWCGSASMEMMLDVPAVRNNNPQVNGLIAAGDGPTVATGDPQAFTNGAGQVNPGEAQAFIYGLTHGTNTVNGVTYSNPSVPVGSGTDSTGLVTGLNLLDNPTFVGLGTHAYTGFNLIPTLTGAAVATRTMVNAMHDYSVPAQAVVESGAHSIAVYGASTNGTPGAGAAYTINGMYVHDPWTGYVASQLAAGNAAPLNAGGWGLGWNTYLRYGYDLRANGAVTQLPNGTVAAVRLGAWFNYFNPSGPQAGGAPVFGLTGVKFTVEPQGPESVDTGNLGSDDSLVGIPELPTEINGTVADTDAIADLSTDPTLSTEVGLKNGNFDASDELLLPMPGDAVGEGDWLVPYDGTGGINDVTGALMIDADTGVIDEATWLDPAQDGQASLTLAQLDQMFADESQGIHPSDNVIPAPEPTSLSLILLGTAGLLGRRRRA